MSEENHRIWDAAVGGSGARRDRRLIYTRGKFWVEGGNQIRRHALLPMWRGREFQVVGAATAKLRTKACGRTCGTADKLQSVGRQWCSVEWRRVFPGRVPQGSVSGIGLMQSYCGPIFLFSASLHLWSYDPLCADLHSALRLLMQSLVMRCTRYSVFDTIPLRTFSEFLRRSKISGEKRGAWNPYTMLFSTFKIACIGKLVSLFTTK